MLDALQRQFAAALMLGPDHVPRAAFAADEDAIIRAMKIHANTISHARLVAIEDSFPRCRTLFGDAMFNHLSRAFLDQGGARGRAHRAVGAGFPEYLAAIGETSLAGLAALEWAWLGSYHAAEARALTLVDLAAAGGAALDIRVAVHPAARLVTVASGAASAFDPAWGDATAVLFTRPDALVCGHAATPGWGDALKCAATVTKIGQLIELLIGLDIDGGPALADLIAAGALTAVSSDGVL